MDDHYIRLAEAAWLAGFNGPDRLQVAARQGRLKTIRVGRRTQFTTPTWLDEYLAERQERGSRRRQTCRPAGLHGPAGQS